MLKDDLIKLENSGLISVAQVEPDLEYLFRHGLIQEAAYESMLRQDRKRLHEQVARGIETLYPERLEEFAPVLALHFDRAALHAQALGYYITAGQAALARFANTEAEAAFRNALKMASDGGLSEGVAEAYTGLGHVLEHTGRYSEAETNYQDMLAAARSHKDQRMELDGLTSLTTIHAHGTVLHDPDKASSYAEQALKLARELGDQLREASVLWTMLLIHKFTGHASEALVAGEQAREILKGLDQNDPAVAEQMAYVLNDLGTHAYMDLGRYRDALRVNLEARPLWKAQNNLPMLVDNLSAAAMLHMILGEYDANIESSTEARGIADSIGNPWGQAFSRFQLGMVQADRGDFADALQTMNESIGYASSSGFLVGESVVRGLRGIVLGRLGAIEEGLQSAEHSYRIATESLPAWSGIGLGVLAWLYARKGDLAQARHYRDELTRRFENGTIEHLLYINPYVDALSGIELTMQANNPDAMLAEVEKYLQYTVKTDVRWGISDVFLCKGMALMMIGDTPGARAALEESLVEARRIRSRWHLWRTLSFMAEQDEDAGQKHAHHAEAVENLQYVIDHAPDDLRAGFVALPEIKAVMGGG
jgi:tetratricopeptide (TPR) repeat protein